MIRKYNEDSKKWEVIGSGKASSISLDNPEYSDASGNPITVSEGFSQINDRIETIEKNVSYIYKNGTIGGGSSGGSGTGSSGSTGTDAITLTDEGITVSGTKNFLYIGSDSATVNFYIKTSGTTSKYFVTAKLDNKVVSGWNSTTVYSSKNGTTAKSISLSGIQANATLVISALDSNGVELDSYTLFIRVGSYSFSMEGYTNVFTTYFNDVDSQNFRFYVKNNIPGSTAYLTVKCNSVNAHTEGVEYSTSSSWDRTLYFGDLLKGAGISTPEIGAEYRISAYVEIQSASLSTPITSESIDFTVFVADSSALTIVVSGNYTYSETTDEDKMSGQPQDDNISINIQIVDSNYSSFRLAYKIIDGSGKVFYVGDFNNFSDENNDTILTGYTKSRQFNPVNLGMSTGRYTITVKAWASSYEPYTAEKTVAGLLVESENIWVPDYNPNQKMVCQFNAYSSLKNPQDTIWRSTATDAGKELYPTASDTDTKGLSAARVMRISGTNGQTSGFISSSLTSGSPALRLSGKSYARIDFSPFATTTSTTGSGYYMGKLQSNSGFVISCTFKSDVHPNSNGTILDIGDYSGTELSNGLHIGLNEVVFKFRDKNNVQNISTTIIQNELNTIDLVYEVEGTGNNRTAGLKLYHNGVASAAYFFNSLDDVSITAESVIWFGTRNTQAGASTATALNDNYCDVNIYDFKIYASSLNAYGIVRNYINAKAKAELEDGNLNWTLIKNLRINNFLNVSTDPSTGEGVMSCELCDANNEFDDTWSGLYDQLKSRSNNPIPILLITVTDAGFYQTYHKNYSTTELENLSLTEFSASYTYTDTTGQSVTINTSSEQSAGATATSPYITLQGTTTMGYSAKNLELYMGTVDGTNGRLFTPRKNTWLPENRFTLKADVVDSAHCNNASVGKFINESGVFGDTPAQTLESNPYAGMVKHTLEGFPVYLFVQYSSNDSEAIDALGATINTPQFMGIYSFNLGRGSYYNMGFEVLSNYVLSNSEGTTNGPSLVNSYTILNDPYQGGCFSYECNQNNNEYGSFQQDDSDLISMFMDKKYPTTTTSTDQYGFNSLKFLFTILANCYDGESPTKYVATQNENGEYVVQATSDTYKDASTYYTATYVVNRKFSWKNANAYFLLAMALGMVDSLGKNMTLRTWNSNSSDSGAGVWYTCFYDMDTCLGLNNYGAQIISKDVSLNKYENTNTSGITAINVTENYSGYGSSGYSTYNSRLWNVVTKGILAKDGNIEIGEDGSYRTMWIEWRQNSNIFADYTNFLENYYKSQISGVGEIMFNLDYKIKYFDPYNTFETSNGVSSRKDTESINFLHGRRIEYVTDWLKDRLRFLDAIFLYDYSKKSTANISDSQYLSKFSIRGSGQSGVPSVCFEITAAAPSIFEYTVNTSTTRAILEEDTATEVWVPMADGDTQVTMNLPDIISDITNFSAACWSDLSSLGFTNLEAFNLDDMNTLGSDSALGTTGSNPISKMTELRELTLKNLKVKNYVSGIPVVCTNCTKLRTIDISNSDVSSINLPEGGCLESLIVSGSKISNITITSQPFLDTIDFTNCTSLQSVVIKDCESITTLNLDGTTVASIDISNCSSLQSLSAKNCKNLRLVRTDSCQVLTTIDLTESCIGMDDPDNVTLNFLGANALSTLKLSGVNASAIALNEGAQNTLSYCDISNSGIYKVRTKALDSTIPTLTDETYPITDFSDFLLLTDSGKLLVARDTKIKYLRVNTNRQTETFDVNSGSWLYNCTSLIRVLGHLKLNSTGVFSGKPFFINNPDTYTTASVSSGSGQKLSPSNGNNEGYMDSFRTVWLNDSDSPDGYSTNITINTSDLGSMFSNSSVNIYDVYYILSRCQKDSGTGSFCKADVTSLSSCFQQCSSIVTSDTNPLGRYTFKYCPSVTSVASMFWGSGNVKGPLFSPTIAFSESGKYDGLYSPLKKLINAGGIWYGSGIQWIDTYFYYKVGDSEYLKITNAYSVAGGYSTASVKQAGVDNTKSPLLSSKFLVNLPSLTSTDSMFLHGGGNTTFEFETVIDKTTGKEVTLFLHNNPNVTTISNTFMRGDTTSGYSNTYVLTGRITAGLLGGTCGGQVTYDDPDTGEEVTYTGFPKNITGFSGFLCSRNSSSTVQLDWTDFDEFFDNLTYKSTITNLEYMWGRFGTDNYIKKGYNSDGTKNNVFPVNIFKGMSALTNINGFFNDHGIENTAEDPLELPGDMFSDTPKLQNIRALFANSSVPSNFHVKLTSLGFRNCILSNVAYSFCRVGKLGDTAGEYAGIPYRFFYMDYDSSAISIPYEEDKETLGKSSFTRKVVRNTITYMDYAFYGNTSFAANGIQYSVSDNGCRLDDTGGCGDLLWANSKYDPRTKVLKDSGKAYNETSNPYIDNPDYSPEPLAWDEWATDGVYRELLEPTSIKEAGAVYIDTSNKVDSYEVTEEVDLSGYTIKVYDEEGADITESFDDLGNIYDGKKNTFFRAPKDNYVVIDFGGSGARLESISLWNDGIYQPLNNVVAVYGEVPDDGVFNETIDLSSLVSVATTSDTTAENSNVTENAWETDDLSSGYLGIGTLGKYRYLVLYNGIDEDEAGMALAFSELIVSAKITKNNITSEIVKRYGAFPDTYNTADDQKFTGGRAVTTNIGGVNSTYGYCYTNFLAPSDLFRYCASNCSVTYALGALGSNSTEEAGVGRLRGRIQPQLFSTLTATTSFQGIFSDCHYIITPYIPYYQEDGTKAYGSMFPGTLFKNNSKVTSVYAMFSYIHIPRNIKIPSGLFGGMGTALSDIRYLFYYASWAGGSLGSDSSNTDLDQLGTPFSGNKYISNADYAICSSTDSSTNWSFSRAISDGCGQSVKYINKDLFSAKTHTALKSVNYMFCGNSGAIGNLPELWTFGTINYKDNCYTNCTSATNFKTAQTYGYAK